MIRYNCPACFTVMTAPEKLAGEKGACPKCGQRVQVPRVSNKTVLGKFLDAPLAAVPAAAPFAIPFVEPIPDLKPRVQRREDQRPRLPVFVRVLLLALAISGGICLLVFISMNTTTAPQEHNALCPFCSEQFTIPEKHRGNMAQWTRDYRCPSCGQSWPAGILYKSR